MDTMSPMSIFLVTTEATAGPESEDADGRRYTILAFAQGDAEDAAQAVVRDDLAAQGYIEVEIERTGEITDPTGIPEDLRNAYHTAVKWGCALIIYDEP